MNERPPFWQFKSFWLIIVTASALFIAATKALWDIIQGVK